VCSVCHLCSFSGMEIHARLLGLDLMSCVVCREFYGSCVGGRMGSGEVMREEKRKGGGL